MASKLSTRYEYVAQVLVEALFFGSDPTAKKYGISAKTLTNYRKRLNTDEDLLLLFQSKKQEVETNWVETFPIAIRSGVEFLLNSFAELEPTAENVHAVTGAIKILAEIGITKEMFDVRYGLVNRKQDEEMGQLESGQ